MKTDPRDLAFFPPKLQSVVGVDFSGAALSGATTWMAEAAISGDGRRLHLKSLASLGFLAGDFTRSAVTTYLVNCIMRSQRALWGMDFPFGLPVELGMGSWQNQLRFVSKFGGNAKELGRQLVDLAIARGHRLHVRRSTDLETKTPFDCYHYRIIYQTFHGMRDVLLPLVGDASSCVLPFQYRSMGTAERWIVEACPSSTLKRLGLPYRRYKQSAGKEPTVDQVNVRRTIVDHLIDRQVGCIAIPRRFRDIMFNDSGGDALDAVLAAVGSYTDFIHCDHAAIARHARYKREGRVYA
jgi:hypothetical protein